MQFTKEQSAVIESRGKNLLVSAAAGSGKTAVLIERILGRVLDRENPVDIDRLLIVTFTRAAAAEMRDRLRSALEAAGRKEPGNQYIKRQLDLLHTAYIMTIDSFCSLCIKENFDRIGIDPKVRVGNEQEVALLEEDALSETLDSFYEEGGEEFYSFLEAFSGKKDDADLAEAVLRIFRFSRSMADPEAFLDSIPGQFECSCREELCGKAWFKKGMELAAEELKELSILSRKAIEAAESPGGPEQYISLLQREEEELKVLSGLRDYEALRAGMEAFSFGRLPSKRSSSIDPEIKELVKSIRDNIKDRFKALKEAFFASDLEEVLSCIQRAFPAARMLSKITKAFAAAFSGMKEEKGVIDFPDLEFMTLKILETSAAEEYRERFIEVMTDEYQDTNRIQEAILTSIAGKDNYFCVGDVKQSIYGFRLADPSIFIRRYHFSAEDPLSERIVLSRNFRSRKEVLNCVNDIFSIIMHENVGNVEYDEDAMLNPGAPYTENGASHPAELLLLESDADGDADDAELEARAAVMRIKEMAGSFPVEDIKQGVIRPAEYRDFVILLRSTASVSDSFSRVFEESGIPFYLENKSGYFESEEIKAVLSFINIIDNPRQDIELAASMKGTAGNFSDEELSWIRAFSPEASFYDALLSFAEAEDTPKGFPEGLREKCRAFLALLERYRDYAPYMPIHELIRQYIEEFRMDVLALSKGGTAYGNLQLLISRAADYEKTSYRGLFHFLRYIEKLKKSSLDFGEAPGFGEGDNVVRIMTMHKSKGLEFPIVFLSCLSRRFNLRDAGTSPVMDQEYGMGFNFLDPGTRIRYEPLIKTVISKRKRLDYIGEELRVLYVAMTRAKEKLIMTAAVKEEPVLLKGAVKEPGNAGRLLDFLLYAVSEGKIRDLEIKYQSLEDSMGMEVIEAVRAERKKHGLGNILSSGLSDPDTAELLEKNLDFKYPYEGGVQLPGKVSVSFLKHGGEEETEIPREHPAAASDRRELQGEGRGRGKAALRGTACHKAFELLDFAALDQEMDAASYLENLARDGYMDAEEAELVDPPVILNFIKSPLAGRMKKAGSAGRLWKEQPFLIMRPADEIDPSYPHEENILVQGIVDAYFVEDGKIVVVDYKTDRVKDGEELVLRYEKQLFWYALALSQITGLEVKEEIIYSVCLGTEIPVQRRTL